MAETGFGNSRDRAELIRVRLRMVAIAALLTGAAATLVFTFLVYFMGDTGGTDYAEIVQAYSVTRTQLPLLITISGLVLLVVVCLTVWLVALYGSFRIAGPLYRFRKNLQGGLSRSEKRGIRHKDALQDLSESLLDGISSLNQHYHSLEELVDEAIQCTGQNEAASEARLSELLTELKAAVKRVRLND